jgi:DNA invertase Pin-like site-specific DNA recombinase
MAGGESEKTSMRVKAAHTQMTSDGIWRGGKHPYGYKLVHNGRVGKKNRQLYDLEIDPVQAPIVQEIFKEFLCINSLLSTKPLCLKQLYLLANI